MRLTQSPDGTKCPPNACYSPKDFSLFPYLSLRKYLFSNSVAPLCRLPPDRRRGADWSPRSTGRCALESTRFSSPRRVRQDEPGKAVSAVPSGSPKLLSQRWGRSPGVPNANIHTEQRYFIPSHVCAKMGAGW